jgi:magnesium transporter
MLQAYAHVEGRLRAVDTLEAGVVWLDLHQPDREEERAVETVVAVNVPTRAEMAEIEASSRLYQDDDAAFMTVTVPANAEGDDPVMAPVTFVLAGERLVTVRYDDPRAFRTFPVRAAKAALGCDDGEGVMLALLEDIVDRLADLIERVAADVDRLSRTIFRPREVDGSPPADFREVLGQLGRKGDLNSKIMDSLMTLERLAGFLAQLQLQRESTERRRARVKTLRRDVASLGDHAGFVAQKITFLLDATLGMINIEQNATIKIFSVVAVVFLPPTLIASIYGMNFAHMPELDWRLGYPAALALMVVSAILPYWFFKRRRWL